MASASQGQPTQIPSQQLIAQATTVPPLLVVDHASQPFPHAFRHRSVLTRRDQRSALRPLTLSQPLREQVTTEHIPGNTAQVLKRQVIQELKARLRDNGIDTGDENRFSPLLFSFLLPGPRAVPQDWNDLMNNPIFLSPERLRTMISLSPATPNAPSEEATAVFYVRTFTFYLEEFLLLIQLCLDEFGGNLPNQVLAWQQLLTRLSDDEDPLTPIYVRYIGYTTRPAAVLLRFHEDMTTKKVSGFNGDFLRICRNEFPEVLAAVEIEVFDKATIEVPLRHAQAQVPDLREQSAIALFGPTLLNTSVGGVDALIEPDPQDLNEFGAFRTRTIVKFELFTTKQYIDKIRGVFRAAQVYANNHPATTNTVSFPITDQVRDYMANQAMPATYKGCTIMLTIGSDLGTESYSSLIPFFHGGVRSSLVTMEAMENLAYTELGYSSTAERRLPDLQKQGFLPFIDLLPWARKDMQDLPYAMQLLRRNMHASNPVIAVTYSPLVTGVCLGACHQKEGMRRDESISKVSGTLVMSKYDHDPAENDDDRCFIVIPCIHPGSLRYAKDDKHLGRIFAKTLAVAWVAMDVAFDVLQNESNKRKACQQIIARVNAKTGPHTDFGKTFQKVRDDYHAATATFHKAKFGASDLKVQRIIERCQAEADSKQEKNLLAITDEAHSTARFSIQFSKNQLELPASVVRANKAYEQLNMILDCDIAQGTEKSEDRRKQVDRLMNLYKQYLNVHNLSDATFRKQLEKVPMGQWYYLALTGSSHQVEDVPHLLSFFVAKDVDVYDTAWLLIEADVKVASDGLKDFITRRRGWSTRQDAQANIALNFQEQLQKHNKAMSDVIHQLRRWQPVPLTVFEKSPHRVSIQTLQEKKIGQMELKWKLGDQEYHINDFYIPMGASPILPGEERYIAFVKEGIDIRDARGRSLYIAFHRPVTIPVDQIVTRLADHPLRDPFIQLWERETGLSLEEALHGAPDSDDDPATSNQENVLIYPKSFFQGKSRGLPISAGGRTENEKDKYITDKEFPFAPADAGWLVHKFLEEKYPNGGKVDLGSSEVWPESTSAWKELQSFLSRPIYMHHPQRLTLLAAAASIKSVGLFSASSGEGPKNVKGLARLIRVLRPPASEINEKGKNPSGGTRAKTVIIASGTAHLPANALVSVPAPQMEPYKAVTKVTTVDNSEEREENDLGYGDLSEEFPDDLELSPEELLQQDAIMADLDAQRQRAGARPTETPSSESRGSKRGREADSDKQPAFMTYKEVKKNFSDNAIVEFAGKYGWNPKTVLDDEEVLVDVDKASAGVQKKVKTGQEYDDDDDEMLLH